MAEGFTKFPRTPHLFWLGTASLRDDKLMEPADAAELLRHPISVEEKVDGANLGLSLGDDGRIRGQSRGSFIQTGTGGQWQPLWRWIAERDGQLRSGLPGLIAFGEWCYARHTVSYDALTDWFLLFDVYDRGPRRFWARSRRDAWATEHGLSVAPLLVEGRCTRGSIEKLLDSKSRVGSAPIEGVYLRCDEGDWLEARAKVVRAGWLADDEHWSARPLEANRLAGDLQVIR